MKTSLRKLLAVAALSVTLLLGSPFAFADDGSRLFTVGEGASPWFDRVGQWSLTNIPDSLKGSGPLPQGECSRRSLDVPGKPASILIGVQVNDVAKFTEKFPAAKDTGMQIAVKNPAGASLPYTVFLLSNPPALIDGAGVFGAGLLLLKTGTDEPPSGKSSSASEPPAAHELCTRANWPSDRLVSPTPRLV